MDDHYEVYVDGYYQRGWRFSAFAGYTIPLCGGSWDEFPPVTAYSTFIHSGSTLTLRFINMLDQGSTDESLGIREVKMKFLTETTPKYSICGRSNGTPLPNMVCPCDTVHEYMNPPNSGTCFPCNANCNTCYGSGSNNCYSCYDGSYLSGTNCYPCNSNCLTCVTTSTTCTSCQPGWFMVGTTCYPTCNYPLYSYVSGGVTYCATPCPGQYVWWDQSCSSTCAYSNAYGSYTLQPVTINTFLQCNYPCGTTQFLYFNTSCLNSCPAPLTDVAYKARDFCGYSCGSTQYLYWNGSCLNNCPWPLSPETQGTILPKQFCWYYCQPSEYMYWNGSCISTCPSPLSPETQGTYLQRKFCWYACAPSQYLYWNGSCLNNCPWPLSPEVEGSIATYKRNFCWYYCQPGEYMYWNGSCISTCPWPLTPETQGTYLPRKFCWYTCQPGQYLYWNGSCLNSCPWPLSPETQGTYLPRQFCWYYCQPSEYLYWNGSCVSDCPSPLAKETQGTYLPRQFCWYLCQPSQYLYWNLSCLNDCPAPLTPETQGSIPVYKRNFCWYTCQPGEFLLWNYTCSSTCPYPLTNEVQGTYLSRKFCWYPCMPWQWLNWDQTCQQTCTSPLWPETQGSYLPRQFCWYPCTNEAKFLYWNGTCLAQCPEPLTTRYQNGQWFCDYPCATTQFLYWNGSCLSTCISPLAQRLEGTPIRQFCYYLCQPGEFLYWDGTCQSTCNFPLTPVTQGSPVRQFCWYLCPTTQFLYWNGTCSSQCDPPLTQRTTNSRKFCDYACNSDQYLAWNGTCINTCPYSLSIRTEGSPIKKNFCDFPCPPTQYLYWNGTCLSTCFSPLSARIEGNPTQRRFCDYPCVGNQYLYWNGTCKTTCTLPHIIRVEIDKKYCDYLCPATQILYWDGSCGTSCASPLSLVTQGTPSRQYCKFPCSNGQFLYPNGTCSANCNFPLTNTVLKSQLFCHYPCSGTQFLYWNGSCLSSCSLPLISRTENSLQYCDYPCVGNQYLYWNGSCIASCAFPLTPRTTQNNLYCDFSCSTTTDYLYWNGTCSSQCLSPLASESTGTASNLRNFCGSPCLSTQYLYWNGTCSASCNTPLSHYTNNGTQFCDYPCNSGEFLYWNTSCLTSCPSPLSTRIEAGNNYCDHPCSSHTDFVYWNSTCSSYCDFPLQSRNETDVQYCDYPCQPSQYLFFTGACLDNCLTPYMSKLEGSRNFCIHNCSYDEFLYWNGSCRDKCEAPRQTISNNNLKYCEPPCSSPNIYYHETLQSCQFTCDYPNYAHCNSDYWSCKTSPVLDSLEASSSAFDFFLHAPLEPGTLTIVNLVKIMQYVRYLDIKMPPRLERLGKSRGRNVLSVSSGIKMWNDLQKDFALQALEEVYSKNNLHSSFLVNYWENLATIIIGIFLAMAFLVLEKLSRALEAEKAQVIFRTLRIITKWNYVVMVIAINLDDIILFSALQIKTWNSSTDMTGFIINMVAIAAMFSFLGLTCYLAFQQHPKFAKNSPKSPEDYQVVFRGLKPQTFPTVLFFPFYTLRIGFPMLISVLAQPSPIANTVIQVLISLGVLTFIAKTKPFLKKVNFYQLMTFEAIVLIMNASMLAITVLSHMDKENYRLAIILADIVIIGNDCINVLALFFLVLKLHLEIKLIQEYTRKKLVTGSQKIGLWVQLLFVPLQQANMGFEEMIAYPTSYVWNKPKVSKTFEESEASIKKNMRETPYTPFNDRSLASGNETNRQFLSSPPESLFGSPIIEPMTEHNSIIDLNSHRPRNDLETFGDASSPVGQPQVFNFEPHREEPEPPLLKNPRSHHKLPLYKKSPRGILKAGKSNVYDDPYQASPSRSPLVYESQIDFRPDAMASMGKLARSGTLDLNNTLELSHNDNEFRSSSTWLRKGSELQGLNDSPDTVVLKDEDPVKKLRFAGGEDTINFERSPEQSMLLKGSNLSYKNSLILNLSKTSPRIPLPSLKDPKLVSHAKVGKLAYNARDHSPEKVSPQSGDHIEDLDDNALVRKIKEDLKELNKRVDADNAPKQIYEYLRKSGKGNEPASQAIKSNKSLSPSRKANFTWKSLEKNETSIMKKGK